MSPAARKSILVAEDSAVIQVVLREMLTRWGYDVTLAPDGQRAWEALRRPAAPRLAVVDWVMPRLEGPELCRRLRAEAPEPYTFVLMLTSRAESHDIAAAFDAGADDYLAKPFHAQELWARIRAGARLVSLQDELREARRALADRESVDELTGLLNRAAIVHTLDRAEQDGGTVSIVLVDINRMRQVNEFFGNPAGDRVLRECAQRIRSLAPAGAAVGRYCGDQFLVVLTGVDRPEAEELSARIVAAIASDSFSSGAVSFPITCRAAAAHRAPGVSTLRAAEELLTART